MKCIHYLAKRALCDECSEDVLTALQAELSRVRRALEKYGRHSHGCKWESNSEALWDLCDCGLWKALSDGNVTDNAAEIRDTLKRLVDVINSAGLLNLSNGVQLGPTVWYVKASEIVDYATKLLTADGKGKGAA